MLYYLWYWLGYDEDEITYKSVKEIKAVATKIDNARQEAKKQERPKTRAYNPIALPTSFHQDLSDCLTDGSIILKRRYEGVKGLDGEIN